MENPIAFAIVVASVIITFYISYINRRHTRTTAAFYVAGGSIPWRINGLALFGDFCSAASFLGIAGAIAISGIDGWWVGTGFFAGWVMLLLVIAGPLKSAGKFTAGDVLAARFEGKGVKLLAMLTTIVLGTLYLVPQIVGAGHLFKLLLGWDFLPTVITTGVLMALFVLLGGMRGTTFNQAVQGIMLWLAMVLLVIIGSAVYFGWNPFGVIKASHEMVPPTAAVKLLDGNLPEEVTNPENIEHSIATVREMLPDAPSALTPGVALKDLWNQLSFVLALLFGIFGLPHLLVRCYTVKDAKEAQKSIEFTIWGLVSLYIAALLAGLLAMYMLYPTLLELLAKGERGVATNMALPMMGQLLGGEILLGVIAAGALAAMLSTATGLLLSAITSLAHDFYAGILKPNSSEKERLLFAKASAIVLTVLAIAMAIWLKDMNVGILVVMSLGIAASTFAPALVLTIWWKKLTRQGVIAGISVGLICSLAFTFARFFEMSDLFGIPVLINPALYSIPVALVVMILVSYLTDDVGKVEEFMAIAQKDYKALK